MTQLLSSDHSLNASVINKGKTHTMLGPNPRKVAGTPTSSSAEFPPKTAISIQAQSTEGGLMVKAMDEIFRHVEQADNPDSFKVINTVIVRIKIFSFGICY